MSELFDLAAVRKHPSRASIQGVPMVVIPEAARDALVEAVEAAHGYLNEIDGPDRLSAALERFVLGAGA